MTIEHALDRTARLVSLDIFGDAVARAFVVEGFLGTTARIHADDANLMTPNGQTAVATLFMQLSMMGIAIDLQMPSVATSGRRAPLVGDELRGALRDYAADSIPGLRIASPDGPADISFVIGDTPTNDPQAVRLTGSDWTATVGASDAVPAQRWRGDWPVGALAAAAAGAAEGLRAVVLRIAAASGLTPSAEFDYGIGRLTRIDLSRFSFPPTEIDLGRVDIVSGGAITNSALYTLLLIPGLVGRIRIVEPEPIEITNLNRYSLARHSDIGCEKTTVLSSWSTELLEISGTVARFDRNAPESLRPLAPTLLVGADQIPVRWVAQATKPPFLCIGATSHFFVTISSHAPMGPCAGCAHARDEWGPDPIPTISFVSLWAGLLQALHLLAHAAGLPVASNYDHCFPLGLSGPHAILSGTLDSNPRCAVRCSASRVAA